MQSSKEQQGEIRKPSSVINAKKQRKTIEQRKDQRSIQGNQRTFHVKMVKIKDRNGMDLTEPNISVLYRAHRCMKCSLGNCNFLEEISSLSHSVVFLYFFALIAEEGFLISSCYSLGLCIQMLISFIFSLAFHFSSFHSYFLRPPQTAILLFCISFPWGWS